MLRQRILLGNVPKISILHQGLADLHACRHCPPSRSTALRYKHPSYMLHQAFLGMATVAAAYASCTPDAEPSCTPKDAALCRALCCRSGR